MLGELYMPSGLALETAQAVLEVKEPYACNVALGCPNGCSYCYGPRHMKMSREQWKQMRFPKESPKALVEHQFESQKVNPQGVFLSFCTDLFHPMNRVTTEELIYFLVSKHLKIATSSKLGISEFPSSYLRTGLSIVSLDRGFKQRYEPNAIPLKGRVYALIVAKARGHSTWAALEPYPSSAIWKQDFTPLLEELKWAEVDLIVFGKWNYDKRANTEQARKEYHDNILILRDFGKSNKIRLHVKSGTMKFAFGSG